MRDEWITFDDGWRISGDGVQWILERKAKARQGFQWSGRRYCRTRAALLVAIREEHRDCIACSVVRETFPERYPEGGAAP